MNINANGGKKKNVKVICGILAIVLVFLFYKLSISSNYEDDSVPINISNDGTLIENRSADPKDLQNLGPEQLELEKATDPLPESTFCTREVFLLILVISQPGSFKRRDNIRDSWAFSYEDDHKRLKKRKPFPNNKNYFPKDVVKTVFIVGLPDSDDVVVIEKLRKESRLSKDIVFGKISESYRNLTLKTKLALKWAAYKCDTTFVIKTDDDVFVNPVVLVEWLKEMPLRNLYSGSCDYNSPVIRDKNSKW